MNSYQSSLENLRGEGDVEFRIWRPNQGVGIGRVEFKRSDGEVRGSVDVDGNVLEYSREALIENPSFYLDEQVSAHEGVLSFLEEKVKAAAEREQLDMLSEPVARLRHALNSEPMYRYKDIMNRARTNIAMDSIEEGVDKKRKIERGIEKAREGSTLYGIVSEVTERGSSFFCNLARQGHGGVASRAGVLAQRVSGRSEEVSDVLEELGDTLEDLYSLVFPEEVGRWQQVKE